MSYNVAIDGPAGAGKSTIAKAVAQKLKLIYVDTGAMYRAMALYMLKQGIDLKNETAVAEACEEADVTIGYEDGVQVVFLNGENVNPFIRTEEVGKVASVISAQPAVRAKLVSLQQKLAAQSDCIMDGRDIGTCVLPKADVKIYLTASSTVRAKRRFDELTAKGQESDFEVIKKDIEDRRLQRYAQRNIPLKAGGGCSFGGYI